MKYTKHETITTHHLTVDLEPEDYIIVRMNNRKLFLLSYSQMSSSIQMRLSGEGDLLDKPPFFEISQEQMEDLEDDKAKGEYTSISFPSKLYEQVKGRLQGLPILV